MNKPTKISITVLALIVGFCGYCVWSGNTTQVAEWCPVGHRTAVDEINQINPQISNVAEEIDRKLPLATERILELHGHYKTERPEVTAMRWGR
jgi:hypothetical protein